jgi:ribosomal protein S18 acetylase RimI-like enzyme
MFVRLLDAPDAAAFHALRLRGLHECPSAFASSYEEEHETPLSVIAERLVVAPDHAVFGAFDGSELVGVVGLRREEARKLAHKALIWGMYVAPNARRRGVARVLLARALEHAASLGVRQVNLGVNATNAAAISLYEALGFSSFGVERGYMLIDGELHDEIHMVCVLGKT